jgi:hypothetical protein
MQKSVLKSRVGYPRDIFCALFFFLIKPLLLVPIDTMICNFDVYNLLVELFVFESDSPVNSPPGSRFERPEISQLFNQWVAAITHCSFLMIVSLKGMGIP